MKDEHAKDAAQDVARDVARGVPQDLAFGGPGGARHATTTAAAVFALSSHSWRYAEMGAQLGSSLAFGSGCG